MSNQKNTPLGRIEISATAIATIASQAALQSYGVVGMADRNVLDGLSNILTRDPRHGVEVAMRGDEVAINVYVIVEYGTRIAAVANSLANTVLYKVEKTFGVSVAEVNVHVQGLRVSHSD